MSKLQYIVDENGNKSSVLVPLDEWDSINDKYNKLLKKVKVLTGIKKAIAEVVEAKKTGKRLMTLNDFLDENSHKRH